MPSSLYVIELSIRRYHTYPKYILLHESLLILVLIYKLGEETFRVTFMVNGIEEWLKGSVFVQEALPFASCIELMGSFWSLSGNPCSWSNLSRVESLVNCHAGFKPLVLQPPFCFTDRCLG